MIRVIVPALLLLSLASEALAEPFQRMNEAEIRADFYGVELIGETARSGLPWRECITPGGETLSEFEGEVLTGQFVVTEDNRACFVYETGPRCFDIFHSDADGTYLLSGAADFKVTKMIRGIEACSAQDDAN